MGRYVLDVGFVKFFLAQASPKSRENFNSPQRDFTDSVYNGIWRLESKG